MVDVYEDQDQGLASALEHARNLTNKVRGVIDSLKPRPGQASSVNVAADREALVLVESKVEALEHKLRERNLIQRDGSQYQKDQVAKDIDAIRQDVKATCRDYMSTVTSCKDLLQEISAFCGRSQDNREVNRQRMFGAKTGVKVPALAQGFENKLNGRQEAAPSSPQPAPYSGMWNSILAGSGEDPVHAAMAAEDAKGKASAGGSASDWRLQPGSGELKDLDFIPADLSELRRRTSGYGSDDVARPDYFASGRQRESPYADMHERSSEGSGNLGERTASAGAPSELPTRMRIIPPPQGARKRAHSPIKPKKQFNFGNWVVAGLLSTTFTLAMVATAVLAGSAAVDEANKKISKWQGASEESEDAHKLDPFAAKLSKEAKAARKARLQQAGRGTVKRRLPDVMLGQG